MQHAIAANHDELTLGDLKNQPLLSFKKVRA